MMRNSVRHASGFSLLELIVVLLVAGILAGVGIPGFKNLQLNSQRSAVVNDFVAAVHLARNEAYRARRSVVVCPWREGRCLASRSAWNEGWVVFVNLDNDDPPRLDAGEPVLRVFPKAAGSIAVRANRTTFAFKPFGTRDTNGTATFCDERGGAQARSVVIAPSGRVRTSAVNPGGSAISCE